MTPVSIIEGRTVGEVAEELEARRGGRDGLNRTALGLIASTVLTAVMGVGFWAVAARLFPADVVGLDSALVASLATLSAISQLNFNNVIVRFLPQIRVHLGRRVVQAYALAGAVVLVAGVGFALIAPLASDEYDAFTTDLVMTIVFVLSVPAWTVFVLEDAVLTAFGRATWLPIENGVFSALKVVALPIAAAVGTTGHGVYLAWVIPMFMTVPVVNWLIARRVLPEARRVQATSAGVMDVFGRRRLATFLAQDFLGSAIIQAASMAIPLIVVGVLGAKQNAYFYMPYTMVFTFDLLFQAVATSLTTEGARTPERIAELTHAVVRRTALVQIPAAIGLIVFAPLILLPFGPEYSEQGTTLLRLLAAASCFRSIQFLFASTSRLEGRGARLMALQITTAVVLLVSVTILGDAHGIDGIGVAWLGSNAALALAVLPSVIRFYRHPTVLAGRQPEPEAPEIVA
jgi:O-antigen/teichoic acid export membrane protein